MKPARLWIVHYLDEAGHKGLDVDLEILKNFNVHINTVIAAVTKYSEFTIPILALKQPHSTLQFIKVSEIDHQELFDQIPNVLSNDSGKLILDGLFPSTLASGIDSESVANIIQLFPYIDILICNLQELEKLLDTTFSTYQSIKKAAQRLLKWGAKSVLIKGGQLKEGLLCQDYWCSPEESFWIATRRLVEKPIDTQNILSTVIAIGLASHYSLKDALIIARMYVQRGLRKAYKENQTVKFFHDGWPDEQIDLPYLCRKPLLKFPQAFKSCQTGLYPIVDSSLWIEKLLAQHVKTIQLRIKNANPLWIAQEIQRSVLIAKKYQAKLFINDYWKLAIQYGASGVHLGQEDLATADIDEIYQSGLYLGVSTHCYYEVAIAHTLNPSYIACGPIYFTRSKIMSFEAQGIRQLNYWRQMLDYPLVAIGGITLERLTEVLQSGVNGVAVISAITQAEDPSTMSQEFLTQIQTAKTCSMNF